jgi:hypothetical protein
MDIETGEGRRGTGAEASPISQREGLTTVELCGIVFVLLLISLYFEYLLR